MDFGRNVLMLLRRGLSLIVVAAMIGAAGFAADALWNDSRLFYRFAGRDALEAACRPQMLDRLAGKGFSPTDLEFSPRPAISFAFGSQGRSRTFDDDFTFSDGPDGQRVDGVVACTVSGQSVTVDVSVDSLPVRAS
jgi:hypothetical protein